MHAFARAGEELFDVPCGLADAMLVLEVGAAAGEVMLDLAAQGGVKNLYLHAFLDGRDTPPKSAEPSLRALEKKYAELATGRTVSICGRA